MVGINTVLDYTIVPNPVHTGGSTQDIVIIATLKTTAEFGQTLTSATIEKIEINFGSATGDPNSLTDAGSPITDSTYSANSKWKIVPKKNSFTTFEVTPIGNGQVITDSIILSITGVQVNSKPGTVAVEITETVSKINGNASLPPPLSATNQTSVTLAKVEENILGGNTFTSNKYFIEAGDDVKLSWDIVANKSSVSLHYIVNDQLVNTATPTAKGTYPGITKHTDGTSLKHHDSYPNTTYSDSKTALKLTDTTIFILEIKSGKTVTYLSLTVIVGEAEITAKDLTVTGDLHVTNKAMFNNAAPWLDFNVEGDLYFRDGSITAANQFKFYYHTPEGSRKLMGSLVPEKLKIEGDIKSTGNITADGKITATEFINNAANIITTNTNVEVGGWKGGKAHWSNAAVPTKDGKTIGGKSGFSLTSGSGNFGYYMIDLGEIMRGTLIVDMYITGGAGIWQILATQTKYDSGKFDKDTTMHVWSTWQHFEDWSVFDDSILNFYPKVHFKGQYIYICAVDQNKGQLGIKINEVIVWKQPDSI